MALEQPLQNAGALAITAQCDRASIIFSANLISEDEHEAALRAAPIVLGNGVALPSPKQYCYELQIASELRRSPNAQGNRKSVREFNGSVLIAGRIVPCAVFDLSCSGVGILTNKPLPAYSKTTFICNLNGAMIELDGEIRHCRKMNSSQPLFLSGIQFQSIGRVNSARWKMVFEDAVTNSTRSIESGATGSAPEGFYDKVEESRPEHDLQGSIVHNDLADHATQLLQRLQRVSQSERRLLLKSMHAATGDGVEGLDDALLRVEKKLIRLRQYEMDLESSLYRVLEAMKGSGKAA